MERRPEQLQHHRVVTGGLRDCRGGQSTLTDSALTYESHPRCCQGAGHGLSPGGLQVLDLALSTDQRAERLPCRIEFADCPKVDNRIVNTLDGLRVSFF